MIIKKQEAERRFDECFSKYEMCNSLHSDSIVLSNWAGTRAPLPPHTSPLHCALALTPRARVVCRVPCVVCVVSCAVSCADALREKAEIVDGEERDGLFKQAHLRYKVHVYRYAVASHTRVPAHRSHGGGGIVRVCASTLSTALVRARRHGLPHAVQLGDALLPASAHLPRPRASPPRRHPPMPGSRVTSQRFAFSSRPTTHR